ncbi:unnamed protein product [Cylicocyclus nassatus]|uniref:Uncharacterized protein n=1 Tax=Cylicocyclus nassatus TaxID=53992 RepID=A0AA36GXF0_CYLNA|nr:unnamed protein product [Cylicocyclus nassatus]
MMYCSQRITKVLKRLQHESKYIQIRMYQILLIEATIPIVLIHIPLTICCVLPLVDLHVEVLLEILPLLFAWYPAISPLLIIWSLNRKNNWRKKITSSTIVTTLQVKYR